MITAGSGTFQAQGVAIAALANNLSGILEHTVVDKTGLTGEYDFEVKRHPDDAEALPPKAIPASLSSPPCKSNSASSSNPAKA